MSGLRRACALLLVASMLGLLAGCNTVRGVGRDIQKGGEAVERVAR